jgi:hypothetical protein
MISSKPPPLLIPISTPLLFYSPFTNPWNPRSPLQQGFGIFL